MMEGEELETTRVIETPAAIHLGFRVVRKRWLSMRLDADAASNPLGGRRTGRGLPLSHHPTSYRNCMKRALRRYVATLAGMRKPHPTDLSDVQWIYIEPHMPTPIGHGRPRIHSLREILNAIFYVLRSGCQWRLLPHDFPTDGQPFSTTTENGAWTALGRVLTEPFENAYEFA
jgi:hypothetical protein